MYRILSNQIETHFYFGKQLRSEKIKKIDLLKLPGFIRELDVKFFTYPTDWQWMRGVIRLAFSKYYDRFIITPDVLSLDQWLFLISCKFLKKKVYTWQHGLKNPKINPLGKLLYKMHFELTNGAFLYGNAAKKTMIKLGYREKKLHVIYNSLDYDKSRHNRKIIPQQPNPYKEHFGNDLPILIFIGRLTSSKKLDLLVKAHNLLYNEGLKTNVVIIGSGEIKPMLLSLINEYNTHNHYWFIEELYDEDLIGLLLFNATLCISPGHIGLTAMHALSYGLPIITNNNLLYQAPECEAIKDGHTGMFFDENNFTSLADSIKTWLKKRNNRAEIRDKCYDVIDSYYNPYFQVKLIKKILYESSVDN